MCNIEGLKSNFNALQNHYLTHKADVICLNETYSNDKNTEFEKFLIQGYDIVL
jgi:exonuclease III